MKWLGLGLLIILVGGWLVGKPQQAEASFNRGAVALREKHLGVANQAFRHAVELNPAAGIHARIGLEYFINGQVRSGLPYLQRAMTLQQRQPWAVQIAYAAALAASGKDDQAERQMEQIMAAMPADAGLLNDCAYTMADANILVDDAVRILERAIQLEPGNAMILDSLGWAYYRQGRLADAQRLLEDAAGRMRDPEIDKHLDEVRKALLETQEEGYL